MKEASLNFGKVYDCAVIGGGPAGLVSAIYLARFKRTVILINGGEPRACLIPEIRNLIGYAEGISGVELLRRLRKQLIPLKVDYLESQAMVSRKNKHFLVETEKGLIEARKVILATGMKDLQPPIENFRDLTLRGVLCYCPICDGYNHSGKRIALIIPSERSFGKVKFMTQFSNGLHVILKGSTRVRKSKKDQLKMAGVKFHYEHIEKMKYISKPKGVRICFSRGRIIEVDVAYVLLGSHVQDTATHRLKKLRKTKKGFIMVSPHQETSIKGLYAVGDCVNGLSQISVAAGHAAVAATHVHNHL